MTDEETVLFEEQCTRLGSEINDVLSHYPKRVVICVIPGLMAAICRTFGVSRNIAIDMFDSALEDIDVVKEE